MGRFHRHADGSVHHHDLERAGDGADHDHADFAGVNGEEGDGDTGDGHHRLARLTDGANASRDVGDHSGYTDTGGARVEVLEAILGENDRVAERNRQDLVGSGVRSVNVMSSPGAGKTSLLKRTLVALSGRSRVGVLEGDIATSIDADQLDGLAEAVALVNTSKGFGGECHLDAVMVRSGLARLPLDRLDLLLIENVGNLVCPAEFDVGADANAMVYAVTEGEEKPLKYPVMFRSADVVVVNKVDLLPHLDFDLELLLRNLKAVNPEAEVIRASARTGEGVDEWCDWLAALGGRSA